MISVKDYKVEISKVAESDGGGYIAHIPELDCFGDGKTVEDAIADVYAVAEDLIEIATEDGKEIPAPQYYKDSDEFSGKLSIRLPKTLHAQLSQRAKAEGCSINQLIISYIATCIGNAFGKQIESLMKKQEENADSISLITQITKELWGFNHTQEFQSAFSTGFCTVNGGVYNYGRGF